MSKARQIADLLDTGGDIVASALDHAVSTADWNTMLNRPSYVTVDRTNAYNISSGTLNKARYASGGSSSTYLRGDGQWITNCTNHANCSACAMSNCVCACACNC